MESNHEDLISTVTKPEKVLDYINSALIKTMFISFAFWWLVKNASVQRVLKKGSKSVSLALFFLSITSSFLCDWLIIFLSSKFNLNKVLAEKMGYLSGAYEKVFAGHSIDLVYLHNSLLTTSQVLRVCSLFLMAGSWLPISRKDLKMHIYSNSSRQDDPELINKLSDASISIFSKLYIFLRIPFTLIFMKYQAFLRPDIILFTRSAFFGTEIALCALFLLILKTKYQGIFGDGVKMQRERYTGINIFVMALLADSFFNHIISVLSIPSVLGEITTYIIEKIGFLTRMASELILLAILCPQRSGDAGYGKKFGDDIISTEKLPRSILEEQKKDCEAENTELVDLMTHSQEIIS